MSLLDGLKRNLIKKDDDDWSSAFKERVTPASWDIESEQKARTERAQAREHKRQLQKMWDKHRDDVYQIVDRYINKTMPNNLIEIQETKLSIKVPYLSLEIKPSTIGIQVVWLDYFKEEKTRDMIDTAELAQFLHTRKRSDWYKVSLHIEDDLIRDMKDHFRTISQRRDIRWSVVGLVVILMVVGTAILLSANMIGNL